MDIYGLLSLLSVYGLPDLNVLIELGHIGFHCPVMAVYVCIFN